MRYDKSVLIASLFGAVVMFVWMAVAHLATPLGELGVKQVGQEGLALPMIVGATNNEPGVYIFPPRGTGPDADAEYRAKLEKWPTGIMAYRPAPNAPMTGGQLFTEFVTEWIEALLAAFLLKQTAIRVWKMRVGFVALVGLLAMLATNLSYWNWYGFTPLYTFGVMLTGLIGFVLAGAVMANLVKQDAD